MCISICHEPTSAHWDLLLLADPSKEKVAAYLKEGILFELKEGDVLLGVLVLSKDLPDQWEIMNLAVAEAQQGRGYAQTLLTFVIEYAQDHRIETLVIKTGSTGFKQLYLYQKMDFRLVSIDPDFFLRAYKEPIYENNLQLKDQVTLERKLK